MSTVSPGRSQLSQPSCGGAPGPWIVSIPLAASVVTIGNGRRTGSPPASMAYTWTYCPARAPETIDGLCQAVITWPGTTSRRSTSSAPTARIGGRRRVRSVGRSGES